MPEPANGRDHQNLPEPERMKKTHHSSIAITHAANKMIKIIWHMLTNRALYENKNEKLYQKKLKRIDAAV